MLQGRRGEHNGRTTDRWNCSACAAPLGPHQDASGFVTLHEDPVDVIVSRYRAKARSCVRRSCPRRPCAKVSRAEIALPFQSVVPQLQKGSRQEPRRGRLVAGIRVRLSDKVIPQPSKLAVLPAAMP